MTTPTPVGAPLDKVAADIYRCPSGLTCRPGKGALYPLPTLGRAPEGRLDILLVGWNPRRGDYTRTRLPEEPTWRREAAVALEESASEHDAFYRQVAQLLPEGHALDDGRVMATHLWKWPTRFKTTGEATDFYVGRCVANHLHAELAALKPRLIMTYETEAADWFASRAASLGLKLNPPAPGLRTSEIGGWVAPSEAWGWRCGLALVKDEPERGYDHNTKRWAKAAGARVLAENP